VPFRPHRRLPSTFWSDLPTSKTSWHQNLKNAARRSKLLLSLFFLIRFYSSSLLRKGAKQVQNFAKQILCAIPHRKTVRQRTTHVFRSVCFPNIHIHLIIYHRFTVISKSFQSWYTFWGKISSSSTNPIRTKIVLGKVHNVLAT
jgi:hypothetical protein